MNYANGSGWDSPYLFVCFNNECKPYVEGWDSIKNNFNCSASYRCITYPNSDPCHFEFMAVFSDIGGIGCIIDGK